MTFHTMRTVAAATACLYLSLTLATVADWDDDTSRGNRYYLEGDYVTAAQYYRDALKENSSYSYARIDLALAEARLGDYQGAESDAAYLQPIFEGWAPEYSLNYGKILAMQGKYRDAISKFGSTSEAARYNRAWCRDALGELEAAREDYLAVLALNEHHAKAMLGLSVVEAKRGAIDDAVWWCKRAAAESRETSADVFAAACRNLAVLRGQDVVLGQASSVSLYTNALSLIEHDRGPEAVVVTGALIADEPESAECWMLHSTALMAAGDSAAANDAFAAAAALMPCLHVHTTPRDGSVHVDFSSRENSPAAAALFAGTHDIGVQQATRFMQREVVTGDGDSVLPADMSAGVDLDSLIRGGSASNHLVTGESYTVSVDDLMNVLYAMETGLLDTPDLRRSSLAVRNRAGFFGNEGTFTNVTVSCGSTNVEVTTSLAGPGGHLAFRTLSSFGPSPAPSDLLLHITWASTRTAGAFDLCVIQTPHELPVCQGFEDPDMNRHPNDWEYLPMGGGSVSNVTYRPSEGARHLRLRHAGSFSYQYALLKLDLSSVTADDTVVLTFLLGVYDSDNYNFGIYLSGNGTQWVKVLGASEQYEYRQYALDVTALCRQNGIHLDDGVFVQFKSSGKNDAYADLDDVRVVRVPLRRYSGGEGTAEAPYLVSSAQDLLDLGANLQDYDKHFQLVNDIDVSGRPVGRALIAGDTSPTANDFNGVRFTGVFSGRGHVIRGLTIDAGESESDYLGLFGYFAAPAVIEDLFLEDVSVTGVQSEYVGGLCGCAFGACTIRNCGTRGAVSGGRRTGGLCGFTDGTELLCCRSDATVSGTDYVGGLCGDTDDAVIAYCHAEGAATGQAYVGGLCGQLRGEARACYARGAAGGTRSVGGLCGSFPEGTIHHCYATGAVTGSDDVGGLCAWSGPSVTVDNSYWDTQTSGLSSSAVGNGRTTAQMKTQSTFSGWSFSDTWHMDGYPALRSSDPLLRVVGLTVSGPEFVDEDSTASYTCVATYGDGSTRNVTSLASWSEDSLSATIAVGRLTTSALSSGDRTCVVTASFAGRSGDATVTIRNVANLLSIAITGPGGLPEGDTAAYTCAARYSDGSTRDMTAYAAWSEDGDHTTISGNGLLAATAVLTNETATVSANLSDNGTTVSNTLSVRIMDMSPNVLPLYESFETGMGGWTHAPDTEEEWRRNSGPTSTLNTGPAEASDGEHYIYTEASLSGDEFKLWCPVDLSGQTDPVLSFDYHMYGVYVKTLSVDVFDGETWWTEGVWSLKGQQHTSSTAAWSRAWVDLSAFAGERNAIVQFRADATLDRGDIAIDNVCIRAAATRTLASLHLSGPDTVSEGQNAAFVCIATYDDGGTEDVSGSAVWLEDSAYAGVIGPGWLQTVEVTADQPCTVTASFGGISATKTITVADVSLVSIAVTGPLEVREDSSVAYRCTAHYSNGATRTVTEGTGWFVASPYATVDDAGIVTVLSVDQNQNCLVLVSYQGMSAAAPIEIQDVFLTSLAIEGPSWLSENAACAYTCIASYSDGRTRNVTDEATWSEDNAFATIGPGGIFNAASIPSDQSVTIYAVYQESSVATQAVLTVTVRDLTVSELPASESFESGMGKWVTSWESDAGWRRDTGRTPSGWTGPDAAADGNAYLYVEASGSGTPRKVFVVQACFDFSAVADPRLRFDYHMYGVDIGTLFVDVFDGVSWHEAVWERAGQQHTGYVDPWSQADVDLSAYTGGRHTVVRFRGLTADSFTGDIAIDHIVVSATRFASNIPYAQWVLSQGIPTVLSGLAETPAGDGSANLLKYACGFPAIEVRDPRDIMYLAIDDPSGAVGIRYFKSKYAQDVRLDPVWADTPFGPWRTAGMVKALVAEDGAREEWEAFAPLSKKGYVRLRATSTP